MTPETRALVTAAIEIGRVAGFDSERITAGVEAALRCTVPYAHEAMKKAEVERDTALKAAHDTEAQVQAAYRIFKEERDEIRRVLNPACVSESIVGAIRNLQQALLSEQGNVETLEARLAALTVPDARERSEEIQRLHDLVSSYDSITDPEAHPDLHARAFALLGDCANDACKDAREPEAAPAPQTCATLREVLRQIATGDFHYSRDYREVAATALGATIDELVAGPMLPDDAPGLAPATPGETR